MDQLGDYMFSEGGWWFGGAEARAFNISLLGKWCWRMLIDNGGLEPIWYAGYD